VIFLLRFKKVVTL